MKSIDEERVYGDKQKRLRTEKKTYEWKKVKIMNEENSAEEMGGSRYKLPRPGNPE
jgi:hypothetical protein